MSNPFSTIALPINGGLTTATQGTYIPPFDFAVLGRDPYDYYWIFVLACIFVFLMACGIGANDVANSFASTVGSKTLKMWQALIIAAFCEFFGAYLLGARVTSTIKSGIVNVKAFKGHDDLFMYGMMCAVGCVAIWLYAATINEFPVSTTHSIVGAVIGFALCTPAGGGAVAWTKVGEIVGSWFLSPLLAGVLSGLSFVIIRFVILRRENSFDRTLIFFPILVFATFTVNTIFILKKGGIDKGNGIAATQSFDTGTLVGIGFGVGAATGLIAAILMGKLRMHVNGLSEAQLLREAQNHVVLTEEQEQQLAAAEKAEGLDKDAEAAGAVDVVAPKSGWAKFEARMDKLFKQDLIHKSVEENKTVQNIHSTAEVFPVKTEYAFGYLLIFTACFASFAHGANDVANAIGPLAGVVAVWTEGVGAVQSKSPVPDWTLALGGAGLVLGLALYGHIIIAALGVKLVKITPARGFCISLATAITIILGSFLGLPLSSTHCTVGAIIGVGVAEMRVKESVNWLMFARVFFGWVMTLIVAGGLTAALFSFGTFGPSQFYPLSPHNCIVEYAVLKNTTAGDPSSYTQTVDSSGLIAGMYGNGADGSVIYSL